MPTNESILAPVVLTLSALKLRGWTPGLVDACLGEPDQRANNPYNGRYPIKLYDRKRVIEAERSAAFVGYPLHG